MCYCMHSFNLSDMRASSVRSRACRLPKNMAYLVPGTASHNLMACTHLPVYTPLLDIAALYAGGGGGSGPMRASCA